MMKNLVKLGVFLAGLLLFLFCFYIGVTLTQTTPKIAKFFTGISTWEYRIQEQTVVYYSDQTEMGRLGYKRQYSEDFPEFLKEAVVAVEDRRFYEHSGFDAKSIGRAIYNDLKAGSKAEGASTITQQLARTIFLSNEKSYTRKIKELFIATAIEDKYTKDAILNMYLNEVFMGRGCSGMAVAANSYFGKDVSQLNKAEMTVLAGIIQAPEYYSPDRNMEGLKQRQQTVVDILTDQGIITASEGQEIMKQKLNIKPYRMNSTNHPYYMSYLSHLLEEIVGAQKLYGGGLKIYTTIDKDMQESAEASVVYNASTFAKRGIKAKDAALVSVDPATGGIKAMVGGVDFEKNQINMTISPRNPGSSIKPLYYAGAINEGTVKPETVLNNKPRDFGGGWKPKNSSSSSPDKATVQEALVHSYNVASVELLNKLGVDKGMRYITSFGITTVDKDKDRSLALALGMTKGISPLEMAAAYSVFPSQGRQEEPFTIIKIVDASKKVIYEDRSGSARVISGSTASTMDKMLKAVVSEGTGTSARIAISSGGKTGTTDNSRDLWYVGYTSELVTAVWVGNSDGADIGGNATYGGTVAGPIWRDYMNKLINKGVLKEGASRQPVQETPAETPAPTETTVPQEPATQPEVEPTPTPTPTPAPTPEPTPDTGTGDVTNPIDKVKPPDKTNPIQNILNQ